MQDLFIQEAAEDSLSALLELYTQLHDNPLPKIDPAITGIWSRIVADPNHHILLGYCGGKLVSSCVVVIVENLTHNQRPYALVENVITHPAYRNKGYASMLLSTAKAIAIDRSCYKIMLMTGAKNDGTLNFYRRAGYNSNDKTAFIQWL